jgi:hypothetical protein
MHYIVPILVEIPTPKNAAEACGILRPLLSPVKMG